MNGSKIAETVGGAASKYGGLKVGENDCSYVWQIAVVERCEWVMSQENCHSDSLVRYTQLLFCTFTSSGSSGGLLFSMGLILLGLWLLYLFLILATTADNFFCPSLGVIAGVLHLSENIAGVTILAFGNGAPDIFTSLVSDQREMVIMFTELIGAGIFVTAIIAGSIALVASPFRIPFNSFIRDCCFYVFSVFWISYTSQDQVIHLWEAISFIVIYMSFIAIVIAMQYYDNREEKRKAGRIPRLQDPELMKAYVAYQRTTSYNRRQDDEPILTTAGFPLRSRAYSLQAKLDVAIATEIARRMGGDAATDDYRVATQQPRSPPSPERGPPPPSPPSRRPAGLVREFLYDLNPINVQDWLQTSSFLVKTILIVRAPAMFFLQLLIPVVNETAEKRGWSKLLNSLQLLVTPVLSLWKFNVWRHGPVPIFLILFIVSLVVACIVFLRTDVKRCPKYHNAFAFLGFASAMLVVYVVANEVMGVLQCIGYASGISDAMLGITLLAWGNSVGDLISNVAIARRGFPRMGYSACFGGPLFNTLLGLGLSWAISASQNDDYRTKIRLSDMMPGCLAFLLASLGASIIYLNAVGFLARRSYGYLLYSLYFVFMLINILSEMDVIHPLGTDHRDD